MRLSRARRRLVIAGAVLLIFTLVGFLIVPPVLKAQLEKRLSTELGRRVTVQTVRFNPYTAAVSLENFAIHDRDGATVVVGWKRLHADAGVLASVFGPWTAEEISLDGFRATVALDRAGQLSFADVLERLGRRPASSDKSPPPAVRVRHVQVTDAQITFSDASRPQPFSSTIGPVAFTLRDFRTADGSPGAPYHFDAKTESNERFAWSGTLQATPPRSVGSLKVEQIVLKKYAPYYANLFRGEIADGLLSLSGSYEVEFGAKPVLKLRDGAIKLSNLTVAEAGREQPAVAFASIEVTGAEADGTTLQGKIGRVAAAGGHLRVHRTADGQLNLLSLLPPARPVVEGTGQGPAGPAPAFPDVTVGEIRVMDTRIDLRDDAAPRPADLALSGLDVTLRGVSLAEGASMPLSVGVQWAPAGSVKVDGQIGIRPVKADLRCEVQALELLPLSPYLEALANIRLTQAQAAAALRLQAALADGKPTLELEGNAALHKVGLVDSAHDEDLAGVEVLALRGLHAKAGDTVSVTVDEIEIGGPKARATRYEDGSLNLAKIAPSPPRASADGQSAPAAPDAAGAKPRASSQPEVEIGRIIIREGDFQFSDRSLAPSVNFGVNDFGGTIAGLSSSKPGKAEVELKAVINGSGVATIAGSLDPLKADPSVDLKVDVKHVDLQPFSPYSGRFAGYELARGQLLVDVKVTVAGRRIDAANVITLNQFTFGAPVQSPDATSLPVRLGVALLKDRDGRIVIDVPIQGSRDDPEFRIGRVVGRVIMNLLTKAATSPFSLLGAAFGGGEELAFQEFAPGLSALQESEKAKRETMIKALNNRPALSLAIEGRFDEAADGYELKRRKLAERLRRSIWEEKRKANPAIPPPEALTITAQEEAAALKSLFDQTFPPGTQFGTPLPPPPAVAPVPPPPKGWFERLVGAITFQAQRERRAATRENERRRLEHEKKVSAAVAAGRPADEMRGRLAETIKIEEHEYRALAQARAEAVRNFFLNEGKIAADRLFLTQSPTGSGQAGPRVLLHLQ